MRDRNKPWWVSLTMPQVIGGFFLVMLLSIIFVQACGDDEPPIEMYNEGEVKIDTLKSGKTDYFRS